jgi:membrane protein YqaA with SNARE-associated domain
MNYALADKAMIEYLVLFTWSILSASAIPIGSEPYFIAIIVQKKVLLIPIIVAALGNIIGGLSTFWIGYKSGDIIAKKLSSDNQKQYDKASRIIEKYGSFAMIISWVPIIGDIIVALGGVLKTPIAASIFWMSIGKFLRYLLIGLTTIRVLH